MFAEWGGSLWAPRGGVGAPSERRGLLGSPQCPPCCSCRKLEQAWELPTGGTRGTIFIGHTHSVKNPNIFKYLFYILVALK